jgi:F0F1-type ATP synthase membrane subunit a
MKYHYIKLIVYSIPLLNDQEFIFIFSYIYIYICIFNLANLVPLLEDDAARFFRSLSLPLSFLFSLSVASESLLPVLSFRLRALNKNGSHRKVKTN